MSANNEHPIIWVLAGSPAWNLDNVLDKLPSPDHVIAADGGSQAAAHLRLRPSLVIGDLDSADSELVRKWEKQGVEVRRYEHTKKVETDTELALNAALA